MPLERLEGKTVLTVEGISGPEMDCYVQAFAEAGAVQCGFCTPGMVIAAKALLDGNPDPDERPRSGPGLRRNLCRCTGYAKIVDAVLLAADTRRRWQRRAARADGSGAGPSGRGRGEARPGGRRGEDPRQRALRG